MKSHFKLAFLLTSLFLSLAISAAAQDLGPGFTKIKDGIYTFAPDATTTTCSFIVTQEGVVMIDSCSSPIHSRNMLAAIKKSPIILLYFSPTPRPMAITPPTTTSFRRRRRSSITLEREQQCERSTIPNAPKLSQ